ncbi:MAG: hypothetical protein AABY87_01165 [bacterium]|mgnify:CR=1 FL=1
MSTKELQEKILKTMKNWQKVEEASVESTGSVIKKSTNPIVQLVMEIIQNDSRMHHRVQQMIVDSMEKQALSLTPEEMGEVWEMIEKHLQIEKKMVEHVEDALGSLKGKKMIVQEYLLNYLLTDERKHDKLLSEFNNIKKGMYPYA